MRQIRSQARIRSITLQGGSRPFQGYLNTIKAKTGKGPDDFRRLATEKGFTDGENIKPGVKAGDKEHT